MFLRRFFTALGLAAIALGIVAGTSFAQERQLRLTAEEMESMGLYECSLMSLDLSSVRSGKAFSLDVVLDEEHLTLDLLPYSLRSPNFRVRAQGEGGVFRDVIPPYEPIPRHKAGRKF